MSESETKVETGQYMEALLDNGPCFRVSTAGSAAGDPRASEVKEAGGEIESSIQNRNFLRFAFSSGGKLLLAQHHQKMNASGREPGSASVSSSASGGAPIWLCLNGVRGLSVAEQSDLNELYSRLRHQSESSSEGNFIY